MSELAMLCAAKGLVIFYSGDMAVVASPSTQEALVINELEGEQLPLADLVYGLLLDDATLQDALGDFAGWARLVEYDVSNPQVRSTFERVRRLSAQLRRLLGPDFEAFANTTH